MPHESLKPLPRRKSPFEWKAKTPKGVISQGDWEAGKARKQTWSPVKK